MDKIFVFLVMCISFVVGGVVELENYCDGGILHELRMTDCTGRFPCLVKRQKNYTIEGDFEVFKEVYKPNLLCSTKYLGRDVNLPGHGSCNTIINNESCPLEPGVIYTTSTTFNIPYYVPPKLYEVNCRLVDDDGGNILCGGGAGNVV